MLAARGVTKGICDSSFKPSRGECVAKAFISIERRSAASCQTVWASSHIPSQHPLPFSTCLSFAVLQLEEGLVDLHAAQLTTPYPESF